jgi:hypothetical protein
VCVVYTHTHTDTQTHTSDVHALYTQSARAREIDSYTLYLEIPTAGQGSLVVLISSKFPATHTHTHTHTGREGGREDGRGTGGGEGEEERGRPQQDDA